MGRALIGYKAVMETIWLVCKLPAVRDSPQEALRQRPLDTVKSLTGTTPVCRRAWRQAVPADQVRAESEFS